MGAYVNYIGWASVTPPDPRWWNRAFVLAEQRGIYSSVCYGWVPAVLKDIRAEGDMPTYSFGLSQRDCTNTKISVDLRTDVVTYIGTFTWKSPVVKPCATEGQLQDPLIDSGCCAGLVRDPAGICRTPPEEPGTLKVLVTPNGSGVRLALDGTTGSIDVGSTPLTLTVRPGAHTVYIVKSGYQQLTLPVAVRAGRTFTVRGTLRPITPEPTPPEPEPPAPTCRGEGERVTFPYVIRCCESLVQDIWGVCRTPLPIPPEPVPPEPVPPEPVPPPEECPRGPIYTRELFKACDVGYYQGDLPGAGLIGKGMACICAKDYEPPKDALEISALIPLVLIIGAVILVLGMVKR